MKKNALEGIRHGLRDVQRMIAGDTTAGRIHRPVESSNNKEYLPPTERSPVPGNALRFHDRGSRSKQD